MSELDTKYSKRAVFPIGEQRDFLTKAQSQLRLSLVELAELSGVSTRSINDWKREKYSASLFSIKRICKKLRITLPENIKIKNPFWYVSRAGKIGSFAVYKKYGRIGGDPKYRKKKWYEWWEKEGRFNKNSITACLPISIPKESSDLSEFVGIVLGDGSISKKQITITLNMFDDRDFIDYIKNLLRNLFKINPSLYERKNQSVVNIVVSRTKLVKFMTEMGLKIGGKVRQQVGVPNWINKSKVFIKSCLRGLFDTDGCFYIDKHFYKNKIYYNCAMCFRNYSLPVLAFFKIKLEQLGFHPTRNTKFSVSLRREKEIINYFQEIGSSNPKHLDKFNKYFNNKFGEVPKWT